MVQGSTNYPCVYTAWQTDAKLTTSPQLAYFNINSKKAYQRLGAKVHPYRRKMFTKPILVKSLISKTDTFAEYLL